MPEGDTLFRPAAGLRPHLLGRTVAVARGRVPGPRIERVVGATITAVDAVGKNLLIRFDNGLELRTHLGPDATADAFDRDEALRRLRDPARADRTIAEALLDQRAVAGIGNVYKSEVLCIERVDPFSRVDGLDDLALARLVDRARALLLANRDAAARVTTGAAGGGAATAGIAHRPPARGARFWAYRRAGRPCRRCGTLIAARRHGDLPRTTYWCPRCQGAAQRGEEGPG